MFRDDLVAAHARIESLEREVREARANASEETSRRVADLELQLERERRRARRAERPFPWVWVGVAAAVGAGVFIYFQLPTGDASPEQRCTDGDAAYCVAWGLSLEKTNPQGAEAAYASACELADAQGCYNQGVVMYRERSDRTAAVAAFRKACTLDYPNACANLSALIEDRAEKRIVANKACDLGSSLGCTNGASALNKDHAYKEALPLGRKGCDGGSVGGCENLAWALAMTGDKTKALEAANRGVHINEEHPSAQATLAHMLVINGDVDQAMIHYRRALALEHHPGGNERPMLDVPLAVMIKRDIAEIGVVYPASASHVVDALQRIASLSAAEQP